MKLMWPEMLWLAMLLPCLVLAYLWVLSRRRNAALGYSNLTLIRRALAGGTPWRRHLPPLLLFFAMAAIVIAAARPMAVVTLPSQQQTIMLVMDVSGSMKATDIEPNRISASQAAAKAFAESLPRNIRIGIVAYSETAHLVQSPTLSRKDVIDSIDRFVPLRGTAIGSGLAVALATLFPRADIDITNPVGSSPRIGREIDKPLPATTAMEPVPPGSYETAAIVLLTDGQNTTGPDPVDVAQLAANLGVKVFTVGFGTKEGTMIGFEGWSMRVQLDEDTLKKIAELTRGQYFNASSGADLSAVYSALKSRLAFEKKETEVTVFFALAAGLLTLFAAGLSLWWYGRVA